MPRAKRRHAFHALLRFERARRSRAFAIQTWKIYTERPSLITLAQPSSTNLTFCTSEDLLFAQSDEILERQTELDILENGRSVVQSTQAFYIRLYPRPTLPRLLPPAKFRSVIKNPKLSLRSRARVRVNSITTCTAVTQFKHSPCQPSPLSRGIRYLA